MARVLKREAAKRDLTSLWVGYADNGGIEVADRFLSAVEKTLKLLATNPKAAVRFFVRKPELQGMPRFPASDGFEKILFYFPLKDGVELIRVVHGSRDLERLFAEGLFGCIGE